MSSTTRLTAPRLAGPGHGRLPCWGSIAAPTGTRAPRPAPVFHRRDDRSTFVVFGDSAPFIRTGFVTSRRMSTDCRVRTRTVSFHTRFGSTVSSRLSTRKWLCPVDVEGVVHRVAGVHLVD